MLRDLRYGARVLSKTPGFTLIAVLVMGIGALTTNFSSINARATRSDPMVALGHNA
jgi:hypothetical protein